MRAQGVLGGRGREMKKVDTPLASGGRPVPINQRWFRWLALNFPEACPDCGRSWEEKEGMTLCPNGHHRFPSEDWKAELQRQLEQKQKER